MQTAVSFLEPRANELTLRLTIVAELRPYEKVAIRAGGSFLPEAPSPLTSVMRRVNGDCRHTALSAIDSDVRELIALAATEMDRASRAARPRTQLVRRRSPRHGRPASYARNDLRRRLQHLRSHFCND